MIHVGAAVTEPGGSGGVVVALRPSGMVDVRRPDGFVARRPASALRVRSNPRIPIDLEAGLRASTIDVARDVTGHARGVWRARGLKEKAKTAARGTPRLLYRSMLRPGLVALGAAKNPTQRVREPDAASTYLDRRATRIYENLVARGEPEGRATLSKAFAIASSKSQREGLIVPGTKQLTLAGFRRARDKMHESDAGAKLIAAEYILASVRAGQSRRVVRIHGAFYVEPDGIRAQSEDAARELAARLGPVTEADVRRARDRANEAGADKKAAARERKRAKARAGKTPRARKTSTAKGNPMHRRSSSLRRRAARLPRNSRGQFVRRNRARRNAGNFTPTQMFYDTRSGVFTLMIDAKRVSQHEHKLAGWKAQDKGGRDDSEIVPTNVFMVGNTACANLGEAEILAAKRTSSYSVARTGAYELPTLSGGKWYVRGGPKSGFVTRSAAERYIREHRPSAIAAKAPITEQPGWRVGNQVFGDYKEAEKYIGRRAERLGGASGMRLFATSNEALALKTAIAFGVSNIHGYSKYIGGAAERTAVLRELSKKNGRHSYRNSGSIRWVGGDNGYVQGRRVYSIEGTVVRRGARLPYGLSDDTERAPYRLYFRGSSAPLPGEWSTKAAARAAAQQHHTLGAAARHNGRGVRKGVYRGHTIKQVGNVYIVEAYDMPFRSLGQLRSFLDGHVEHELATLK